jgi:hypothetical protein
MRATTDKDYIDAKLEATAARLEGAVRENEAQIKALEQSVRADLAAQSAQLEANFHRTQSEIIKWVAATCIGSSALTIAAMSFMLSTYTPKSPAPIIVYAQPAPPGR